MATERETISENQALEITKLRETLSAQHFRDWYQERQYRQNIENGRPYFNGSASVPNPDRHSPSKLLQCHRKIVYRQENAPEEQSDPNGIFWFGTRFEEDIVFPFFRETLIGENTYVRNSVWIDFTVETSAGDLQIKGATDPLIVDADAVPILPSEIKTKSSLDTLESPNRHHRAQLHAYMVGLSKKYEVDLTEGIILYGSRKSLDVKIFHVEFDDTFWEKTVLDWATAHTEFRLDNALPPADPVYDWECEFCSFRERCGKGETNFSDVASVGLLPTFTSYPREKLIEYFEAHPTAYLPPSLADQFPEIADEYGVGDWYCLACGSTIAYERVDQEGKPKPACPKCSSRGVYGELTSPEPADQQVSQEPGKSVEASDA